MTSEYRSEGNDTVPEQPNNIEYTAPNESLPSQDAAAHAIGPIVMGRYTGNFLTRIKNALTGGSREAAPQAPTEQPGQTNIVSQPDEQVPKYVVTIQGGNTNITYSKDARFVSYDSQGENPVVVQDGGTDPTFAINYFRPDEDTPTQQSFTAAYTRSPEDVFTSGDVTAHEQPKATEPTLPDAADWTYDNSAFDNTQHGMNITGHNISFGDNGITLDGEPWPDQPGNPNTDK